MGRCAAVGCEEMGHFKFPEDPIRRKKWEKALRRVNFKSTNHSRLCKKHFKETDFETTSKMTGFPLTRNFLKNSAVPSIFSWNSKSTSTSARDQRIKKRNSSRAIPSTAQHTADLSKTTVEDTSDSVYPTAMLEVVFAPAYDKMQEDHILETTSHQTNKCTCYKDVGTQTSTLNRIFSTDEMLVDNESVHYYTGFESYEKFSLVLRTLCLANHLKYKGNQVINLSIEDQFLLFLIKLRRSKSDFELSKFFGVSKTVVSNAFITWINFTYENWSKIFIWPSREVVDSFMPPQFAKYLNTGSIIDEYPTNPTAQHATLSNFKNKNTKNKIVGATPGGLISSQGNGDSTSDRQIVKRSNLLQKCESGDSIMADCGFNVQDISANKNITIHIPPLLKGKSQLSGVTVKDDRKLVSQRVHIERLTELSKTFTILKTVLNPYYVPLASRIFYVCIMLSNFPNEIM